MSLPEFKTFDSFNETTSPRDLHMNAYHAKLLAFNVSNMLLKLSVISQKMLSLGVDRHITLDVPPLLRDVPDGWTSKAFGEYLLQEFKAKGYPLKSIKCRGVGSFYFTFLFRFGA